MDGRTAVVTGASTGIGRATALRLAQAGAAVALLALPGAELKQAEAACREAGTRTVAVGLDVRDPSAVADAFAQAGELGCVDAVFNNAGIFTVGPFTEVSDEEWQRLLGVNLTGVFNVAREAARTMVAARGGAIVQTGSELALLGDAGTAAYTATKGAVLALTRALAAELAPHRIRVNAVCPGPVDTPLLRGEFEARDEGARERWDELIRTIPWRRVGQPEEIAALVTFLLSDEAEYITGAQLVIDGGRTSCVPID